jgi:NAD(P)-dependent dehydrogenase (short-subunit alcohol dehydrogenase family)
MRILVRNIGSTGALDQYRRLRTPSCRANSIFPPKVPYFGDVRVMAQCEAAVRACVDAFGGLNLLINGAAGNFLSTVNELSVNGFKTVMEIDAIGSFQVRRARKQKA